MGVPDERRSTASDVAFETYVLPELEVLYRFARSRTYSAADAEDLVQDTLLRAYRAIERFDGRHPRAWLLTIMRNANISEARRKRPTLLRDGDAIGAIADRTGRAAASAEQTVMDGQFDHEVETAYLALSEPFREAIDLVDLGGLTYDAAASILGIPVGTVMSRLHRGRKRIRNALQSPVPTEEVDE
jgi:RNA polymerase sigma-70 factor (ECF subfamily)